MDELAIPDKGLQQYRTGNAMIDSSSAREAQQVQVAMAIAQRFPRDEKACLEKIITACGRTGLAEMAMYQYSKGGTEISAPSIRLAEAIAQNWKHIEFGVRELEQRNGESTVEAFCWDLENNTRQVKVFQVSHVLDTKAGKKQLTSQRDIYEMVANQGARRVRACILGVIPGDVIDAAVKACDETLNATVDLSPDKIKKLVDTFGTFGVTQAMIEARIQRRIDTIQKGQVVQLRKIYNSLKDGMSKPEDWFAVAPKESSGLAKSQSSAGAAKQKKEDAAANTPPAEAPKPDTEGKGFSEDLPL